MYVYVTRITVKSGAKRALLRLAIKLLRLHGPPGLLSVSVKPVRGELWIREAWRSKPDMTAFRRSPRHRRLFAAFGGGFKPEVLRQAEAAAVPAWAELLPPGASPARGGAMRRIARGIAIVLAALLAAGAVFVFAIPSPIEPAAWRPPKLPAAAGPLAPNDRLSRAALVGAERLEQPEDIAVDGAGRLLTGTADGVIHRVTLRAGEPAAIEPLAETGGRPLGLAFGPDGALYAAVKEVGLAEIRPDGFVRVLADEAGGTPIRYANELAVAKRGAIYFTDASTEHSSGWPYDLLEGKPYGRLLAYDAATGETAVVLDGLHFANGVVLSPEEDYLLVSEMFRFRIIRYWLEGPRKGTTDTFADNLPLMPDNLSLDEEGSVWVAGTPRMAFLERLQPSAFAKAQIAKLPQRLLKRVPELKANRHGYVLKLDANGEAAETFQDPNGRIYAASSAVVSGGKLYVGTLLGDGIGVHNLEGRLEEDE